MVESKRSDLSGVRHHSQTEGSWLSNPHSSSPPLSFQDTIDDSKSVSAWPVHSVHPTPHSSRLNNDHMIAQTGKENKVETATSCRLFGIELIGQSQNSPAIEKAPAHAVSVPDGTSESHVSSLSGTDSDPKGDISKPSQEGKQVKLQVSPKETMSKQLSSRSRTKVIIVDCLFK